MDDALRRWSEAQLQVAAQVVPVAERFERSYVFDMPDLTAMPPRRPLDGRSLSRASGHPPRRVTGKRQTPKSFTAVVAGRGSISGSRDESQWAELAAALDDDFDTPRALAVMHRWTSARQLGLLSRALEIFGLAALARRSEVPALALAMSEQRDAARSNRDFTIADKIRADIEAAGWEVRDDPSGTSILVPRQGNAARARHQAITAMRHRPW